MTVNISSMIQAATVAENRALPIWGKLRDFGQHSKNDTDDTRKDIHREHDSGVPPVLPDVLFVHSDPLAFEGWVLIAPGELDKYEVDDCWTKKSMIIRMSWETRLLNAPKGRSQLPLSTREYFVLSCGHPCEMRPFVDHTMNVTIYDLTEKNIDIDMEIRKTVKERHTLHQHRIRVYSCNESVTRHLYTISQIFLHQLPPFIYYFP